ncbi:hypothetical protein FHR83_006999 [Actinoplanes campanulatus]|uniref:Uncharacterized protein n=1 Tax=Actinoplanes campanulatus TaxID=113559 RepID=A0A7W5FI31_9ACTN|nr:hypothetical protein [Actinoplanes campanulatus]MBB3099293.1 hypothetical protein [Actinoplanes campanulatus]GGN40605.1 hypothetical protein GCM10010109_69930 [Actinoplanes campanulatus]GID40610.1 hypothetical protein Aca09nite_71160 [Actinoplanes campanulatus]
MVIAAVIFIPPSISLDSIYATQCVEYALQRGYRLTAIIREWSVVEHYLCSGSAMVVVVARHEHLAGEQLVEVVDSGPCAPVVDLCSRRAKQNTRRLWPSRKWFSNDRVREILDGDGPVYGLDRETVEALRRIRRGLSH